MPPALPQPFIDLAGLRGLSIEEGDEVLFTRLGFGAKLSYTLVADLAEGFADNPIEATRQASWMLFGVRLGLDQLANARDQARLAKGPAPLRPRPAGVVRYQEVPSIYGDRLLRLVPSHTRQWAEAICGASLFHVPWITKGLETLHILETGRTLLALTNSQAPSEAMDREKSYRDARAALFYDSYKVKPAKLIELPEGQLRIIESVEGLGASRATILPEFDYDSARQGGLVSVPSQDRIIIARRTDDAPDALEALASSLVRHTLESYRSATHPMTRAILSFDPDRLTFSTWAGDVPDEEFHPTPPPAIETVEI